MEDVILTESDKGTSLSKAVGTRIRVQLEENPTTGYQWRVDEISPPVLRLEGDRYNVRQAGMVGGGGVHEFRFVTSAPGQASVRIRNRRGWEPESQAVAEFHFNITVM